MAKASLPELEELISTTGFFRNKAKSIQGAARKIIADFGGEVPQTLAELITIPGAARKTANVVLGVASAKPRALSSTRTSSASRGVSNSPKATRPRRWSRN